MPDTYTLHIKGAKTGFSFTLYLNDFPEAILGGHAPSEDFSIEVPREYTGEGKIKMYGRAPNRTTQNIAYSIPGNLTSKDNQSVNVSQSATPKPTATKPKAQPVVAAVETAKSSPQKSALETIKEVTDNDLREEALGTVKAVTDNKLRDKVQEKKTGESFWDKLR